MTGKIIRKPPPLFFPIIPTSPPSSSVPMSSPIPTSPLSSSRGYLFSPITCDVRWKNRNSGDEYRKKDRKRYRENNILTIIEEPAIKRIKLNAGKTLALRPFPPALTSISNIRDELDICTNNVNAQMEQLTIIMGDLTINSIPKNHFKLFITNHMEQMEKLNMQIEQLTLMVGKIILKDENENEKTGEKAEDESDDKHWMNYYI